MIPASAGVQVQGRQMSLKFHLCVVFDSVAERSLVIFKVWTIAHLAMTRLDHFIEKNIQVPNGVPDFQFLQG